MHLKLENRKLEVAQLELQKKDREIELEEKKFVGKKECLQLDYQGKAGVASLQQELKEEGKVKEFTRKKQADQEKTTRNDMRFES